jgi:hypothetical protein
LLEAENQKFFRRNAKLRLFEIEQPDLQATAFFLNMNIRQVTEKPKDFKQPDDNNDYHNDV